MRIQFITGIVLTLFGVSRAQAGREVGNGGDAVVCRVPGGSISSVEFFDIYEARARGLFPRFDQQLASPVEKVKELLDKVSLRSPTRARLYQDWLQTFMEDASFLAGSELIDIPDTGAATFPTGCTIEQLIIYREPQFPEDAPKKYLINQDLWERMDTDNQAAAIGHELIYREFSAIAKHINSVKARYYNSYLFSRKLESLSYAQFVQAHVRSQAGFVDWKGILIQLSPISDDYSSYGFSSHPAYSASFNREGAVVSAHIMDWDYVEERHSRSGLDGLRDIADGIEPWTRVRQILNLQDFSYLERKGDKLAISGEAYFFSDGSLQTFHLNKSQADYQRSAGSAFMWPMNEKSDLNLLICAPQSSTEIFLLPNSLLSNFEASSCSMPVGAKITLKFSSTTNKDYALQIESKNSYPATNIRLHLSRAKLYMMSASGPGLGPIQVKDSEGRLRYESPSVGYDAGADRFYEWR